MEKLKNLTTLLFFTLLLCNVSSLKAGEESNPYLGRWALHFEGGMGWLEVRQAEGYLDADLLWIGGSVTPVASVHIDEGKLFVTRTSTVTIENPEGKKRTFTITNTLTLEGNGDKLIGKMIEPKKIGLGVNVYYVHAERIPPLPAAPNLNNLSYGKPIKLIGNDLSDWRLIDQNSVNGWKIENGALVNIPVQKEGEPHIHYGNLRTNAEFEDFNLKLKVNVPKGNNSGIYLRGIYEIQVYDSYGKELDSHNMGALYSRISPSVNAEKKAGEWQTMDITLCDRHVTVILNDIKIIDNKPIDGVTGGAITSYEFMPGPLFLQGDHGNVSYKDIVLTPIIK